MRTNSLACLCAIAGLGLVGCPDPVVTPNDTNVGFPDTGPRVDARGDAGATDAGARDTGALDTGAMLDTGAADTGAADTGAVADTGVDAFMATDDAFGLDAFAFDAFSVFDAFAPDAFTPMDAGGDAFVPVVGGDAGRDAFIRSDAGRDAFAIDANRDAFVGSDAFHGDAFLGACAPATHLVINEIDYDQIGVPADAAEFVEIFNPTAAAINLAGTDLVLVNGVMPRAAREYGRVALTGMIASGGYVVVTAPATPGGVFAVVLPPGAARITFSGMGLSDRLQNGEADALVLMTGATVVDTAVYEGALASFLPPTPAVAPLTTLTEGASIGADSGTETGSLSRRPNGCDRNTPMMDWYFTPGLTPGAANP